MRRFPLTLPPIDEIRLEERSASAHSRSGLLLNPPIPVRCLAWRWYVRVLEDGAHEAFFAARLAVDFRLSVPGASASGEAGDYVGITLDEVLVLSREEMSREDVLALDTVLLDRE